jgi:hypothetical protein
MKKKKLLVCYPIHEIRYTKKLSEINTIIKEAIDILLNWGVDLRSIKLHSDLKSDNFMNQSIYLEGYKLETDFEFSERIEKEKLKNKLNKKLLHAKSILKEIQSK